MKYESELIKEIVDSRGHEKSSLHYQSECVEAWIEGTMNVTTNGQTIKPLMDISVPVEAITQNLASFINLETE